MEDKNVSGNVDCFMKKLLEDATKRRNLSEALVNEMKEERRMEEERRKAHEKAEEDQRQAREKILATMSPAQRLIYDAILGLTTRIDDLEDQITSVENDVEDLKGCEA